MIVARHEVPGSDAKRPPSQRDGRSHCQSHRILSSKLSPGMSKRQRVECSCRFRKRQALLLKSSGSDGIGSIVPLGRGYFPHDSRHFVPGYYRAVPPGQKPSPRRPHSVIESLNPISANLIKASAGKMYFVPEGQHDSSQARSAWSHEENSPVPVGRLNGSRLRLDAHIPFNRNT